MLEIAGGILIAAFVVCVVLPLTLAWLNQAIDDMQWHRQQRRNRRLPPRRS